MNLSTLDDMLDKKLGADWHLMEVETLSLTIGALFDDLTLLKVMMLKTLQESPGVILNDAEYMLRLVEIANGNVPDPHHHDIPNGLELVYALSEMEHILGEFTNTTCIKELTKYVIREEGHGESYHPLLSKYSDLPLVTSDKTKAAEDYIKHMQGAK